MIGLYRYIENFGGSGTVEGLFIVDSIDVAKAVGKEIYLGEVLGKHSDVVTYLPEESIELITEEQKFIADLRLLFDDDETISGINPIEYASEQEVF